MSLRRWRDSSKPVAITVILTWSTRVSSIEAPKMTLASASADLVIISAAWWTSLMVKSVPPTMLKSNPLAPSIEVSSKGEDTAERAAAWARFSPTPEPTPIKAEPASFMMVLTSAKSTLISPAVVIKSEIPWTPWDKTLSASLKASIKVKFLSMTSMSLWLGTTMAVSTLGVKFSMPSSATTILRVPSKRNGLVTTATVKAPASRATSAMTGPAPVPVTPPLPQVIKNISDSKKRSWILSFDSLGASRPILGTEPEPKPRVNFSPIWSLVSAWQFKRIWASVLTATNSTPLICPEEIIELTALLPPPPTPKTLILAKVLISGLTRAIVYIIKVAGQE